MEWVETTGRTLEEAKDAALDQLGVDEQDAEFEVLEEPKSGLFGRLRSEARVRARVRPTRPRPKDERRDRRGRSGGARRGGGRDQGGRDQGGSADRPRADGDGRRAEQAARPRRERTPRNGDEMTEDVPLERQAEVAKGFLEGLLAEFGQQAAVAVHPIDEDTVEVRVTGGDLGLLIGPKGQTLQAIQELARTVVQRQTGAHNGRLIVDVAGYRQARREALARFTHEVAGKVVESGQAVTLEPMTPADRKVVHDTVNEIDGVSTTSEGEEPRRRVVILPEPTI